MGAQVSSPLACCQCPARTEFSELLVDICSPAQGQPGADVVTPRQASSRSEVAGTRPPLVAGSGLKGPTRDPAWNHIHGDDGQVEDLEFRGGSDNMAHTLVPRAQHAGKNVYKPDTSVAASANDQLRTTPLCTTNPERDSMVQVDRTLPDQASPLAGAEQLGGQVVRIPFAPDPRFAEVDTETRLDLARRYVHRICERATSTSSKHKSEATRRISPTRSSCETASPESNKVASNLTNIQVEENFRRCSTATTASGPDSPAVTDMSSPEVSPVKAAEGLKTVTSTNASIKKFPIVVSHVDNTEKIVTPPLTPVDTIVAGGGAVAGGSRVKLLAQRMGTHQGRQALREAEEAVLLGADPAEALHEADQKQAVATTAVQERNASGGVRVEKLLQKMTTVEGRQLLREEEEKDGTIIQARSRHSSRNSLLLSPPVEQLGDTRWRVHSLYEHQVLKIGLRALDSAWAADPALQQLPQTWMSRRSVLAGLVRGDMELQSLTRNDISGSQSDLRHLSLEQLLRIRVAHLDYTPSGRGSDSLGAGALGDAQGGFMDKLDSLVFQGIGKRALANHVSLGYDATTDFHRRGREVVFFVAAAVGVAATSWWCWWITDEQLLFFNSQCFVCRQGSVCCGEFPEEGGVFEVNDLSRRDANEPTGALRWFDWRVALVRSQEKLVAQRPVSGKALRKEQQDSASQMPSPEAALGPEVQAHLQTAEEAEAAELARQAQEEMEAAVAALAQTDNESCAAGAATASVVTENLLAASLKSLRKSGGPSLQ